MLGTGAIIKDKYHTFPPKTYTEVVCVLLGLGAWKETVHRPVNTITVAGRIISPPQTEVHFLIPKTYENVILHGKGELDAI